jgi:hypothetical protein
LDEGAELAPSTVQGPELTNTVAARSEGIACEQWGAELEPWPEPVDGNALLTELAGMLKRYVVLPRWGEETLALWTLHTYAYRLGEVSTYIGVESPEKRCGKTTLLGVLSELASRPVVANISPSAFFRVIEEAHPTLLIDEADTFLQGNEELRGILNSGYSRKTAYVLRVAGDMARGEARRARGAQQSLMQDERAAGAEASGTRGEIGRRGSQLARFSCWCPKVLAAIGALPATLADRCIIIRMHRKLAREVCQRLRNMEATGLRRQCLRFVLDHEQAIAGARPAIPAELNDRAADIWEPLLALADLAGGAWPGAARQAAVSLSASAQESNVIGWLFFDIYSAFSSAKRERIFSRELVARLNRVEDPPWSNPGKAKGITELWLARQLHPYGIRPKTMWIENVPAKGYVKEDFQEVFRRYIPRNEIQAWVAEMKAAKTKGADGATAG